MAISPIVHFSIGGKKFSTTVDTLTQREPHSMLAAMFSGRHMVRKDGEGYVFIDRDGKHFRHILNWLRDGVAPNLPDLEQSELLREAEYYQLVGLVDRINEVFNRKEDEEMATDLTRTDIIKIVHPSKTYYRIILRGVNLSGLDLSNLGLTNVDFSYARLKNVIFSRANLLCANFKGVDAENANFHNATLTECRFEEANLRGALLAGAQLQDANLQDACLIDCSLCGANLRNANLQSADLTNANLEGANLELANLKDAKLNNANLKGAKLWEAYLRETDMEGADFYGAIFEAMIR